MVRIGLKQRQQTARWLLVMWLIVGMWTPARAAAAQDFVAGRVLVGWHATSTRQARTAILAAHGWQIERNIVELGVDVLRVPAGEEQTAAAALQADPAVRYAELDRLAYAAADISVEGLQPNDPYWLVQWNQRRIQLPQAWQLTQGTPVLVAVIDSGIDLGHPEFTGRIQDGFDYVDFDTIPQDTFGHGTHVAGIIGAAGNNSRGVAGAAWNVQLLPMRVLDGNGVGTASNIAQAIIASANRGARIINLSLALSGPSAVVYDAIVAARSQDCLLVAATGNASQPSQPPAAVSYPAAYPEVIAVAATTHGDERATYSNGGAAVELAAPGGEASDAIYSTSRNSNYAQLYGTSIAAAHVSGVAALLRSLSPQWSAVAVRDALRNTADKVGSQPYNQGRNDWLGYGRINAAAALRWTLPPALRFSPDAPALLAAANQPLPSTTIRFSNASTQPLTWQVTGVSPSWLQVQSSSPSSLSYPATASFTVSFASLPVPGEYIGEIGVQSTDPLGGQRNYIVSVYTRVLAAAQSVYLPVISYQAATPVWQDTSGSLGLAVGDDGAQAVTLPFVFPFLGRSYSQVYIHANGFLSFGQSYAGSAYAVNSCLPTLGGPNNAIYALWDDLDPGQAGRVSFASSPGVFVAEWRDVPNKQGQPSTFQVALRPNGQVTVAYGATVQADSATVGLESWDASLALPVACNGSGQPPASGQTLTWQTDMP